MSDTENNVGGKEWYIKRERERGDDDKRIEHFERVMRQRQLGNWLRVRNFLLTFNLCRYSLHIYIYIYINYVLILLIFIVSPLRSCATVGAQLSLTLSYYHVVIYYIWCLIHVHGQWLIELIFFMLLGLFWSNRCQTNGLNFLGKV